MTINKTSKFYSYLIAFLLLTGAATALTQVQNHNSMVQTQVSTIEDLAKTEGSSFQASRQADAMDVSNVINNMIDGNVKPLDAHDYIFDKKFFAKNDIDCTPEEMQVNNRYIAYLDSASDVVDSYMYKTGDMQEKLNIMNEKKKLI